MKTQLRLRGFRRKLSIFLMLFALLANGPHALAITITRNFISSGSPLPGIGVNAGGAPATVAGGGNLVDIFNAASNWWETALTDPFNVTISFGWAPLAAPTLAVHNLVAQAGGRETQGTIRFDNDGSTNWFLDATPNDNAEYTISTPTTASLGGGTVNTGRVFTGAVGAAAGRFDLLSVAKHEIGHALGLSSANTSYQGESWPDNDVDVGVPLPLAGTTVPTNNGSVPEAGATSNAHTGPALPNALMTPAIGAGVRRDLSAVDILANAEISNFFNVNLDPTNPNSLMHIDFTTPAVSRGLTPTNLVERLVGSGVSSFSNVVYTGAGNASGTFSSGLPAGIGLSSGVMLTTGSAANALGPNDADDTSTDNGLPGSALLDPLTTGPTFDASVLGFNFIPLGNRVQFNYVFASEEYEEFVNSEFNDVFGFFVNGVNSALLPVAGNPPITVNTVNQLTNPGFYLSNSPPGAGPFNNEYDGRTVVLTLQANVNPGVLNTMQLGIADTSDGIYDSGVFIETGTFDSVVIPGTPPGTTALNPFLPNPGPSGLFGFSFPFVDIPLFIDPDIAVGYDYNLLSGPNFASLILPALPFDNMYDLYLWDGSSFVFDQVLTAGVEHFFGGGGIDRFRILGIDIQNMLDPNDPLAFVTGLTFVAPGNVDVTMTPITQFVQPIPEPSTIVLFCIGLLGVLGYGWRRRKQLTK